MEEMCMFKKGLVLLLVLMTVFTGCAAAEEIHGYNKKLGGYSYVSFGTFPLEADGTEAPILWRVLEVKENEAYLLTDSIVDVHYVHLDTKAYYSMKWEESDLYAYLQTEFLGRAFTLEEQAALLQRTEDGALVTLPKIDDIRNAAYGFADNKSRLCKGTEYAKAIGLYVYGDKYSPWVSRNKSKDRPMQQRRVMDEGKLGTVPCGNVDLGIRPCVYVDLSLLKIAGGDGSKDSPFHLVSLAAPVLETPAPTAVPVMETAGDELSLLIDQMVQEMEATPAPTEVPVPPAPTAVPTEIPATEAPVVEETAAAEQALIEEETEPADIEAAPAATPFTIGGIVYQNAAGEVVTSLKVATPAPTKAPAPTELPLPEETQAPAPEPEETKEPAETIPAATEIPAPSASGVFTAGADPTYIHPAFENLTAEGFLPEGEAEFVLEDEENGLWLYASQTLRIQIERKTGTNSKKQPLRWFEARIFTRDTSELFDIYPWDEAKYTNHYTLTYANEIALKHKLVFAINSDYFIFREARQHDADVNYNYPKGLIIRDRKVLYDVPRSKTSTVYPPLDVMAFFPDGTMKTYLNGTLSADEILKTDATDTISFGPILVENGEVSPRSKEYGNTPNPRTPLGYGGPGHYVCVVVESRTSESKGESCVWMGQVMADLGCETALNLDGGATSTMLFMGKQINKSGNYGDITNRQQNELIGIGISDNVTK